MHSMDGYAIGALALMVAVFYFIRKIPVYATLCSAILAGFVFSTFRIVNWQDPAEWIVMTAGLASCSFGLLMVRVMLVRSVSLQLLAKLMSGRNEISEDIGGRLKDMMFFRIVRQEGDEFSLTTFGWFCSSVTAFFYSIFYIKS